MKTLTINTRSYSGGAQSNTARDYQRKPVMQYVRQRTHGLAGAAAVKSLTFRELLEREIGVRGVEAKADTSTTQYLSGFWSGVGA